MFIVTCVYRAMAGVIAAHALLCFSYVLTAWISAKIRRKYIEYVGWSAGGDGFYDIGK